MCVLGEFREEFSGRRLFGAQEFTTHITTQQSPQNLAQKKHKRDSLYSRHWCFEIIKRAIKSEKGEITVLSHANSGCKSAEIPHAYEKLVKKWT